MCDILKQRKSPENGDWKNAFALSLSILSCTWNKENLLKMEIERHRNTPQGSFSQVHETKKISWKWRLKVPRTYIDPDNDPIEKQRKSPENGDWKFRLLCRTNGCVNTETKKISWKWRLKGIYIVFCIDVVSAMETKKISWKWRLKVNVLYPLPGRVNKKQRKSPENGDWKLNAGRST